MKPDLILPSGLEIAFGCGFGKDRSFTAAYVMEQIGKEIYGIYIKTHYLGIDDPNLRYCSEEMMHRKFNSCDFGFVMQPYMVKDFHYITGITLNKIKVLSIDDSYDVDKADEKKALEDILEKKLKEAFFFITEYGL